MGHPTIPCPCGQTSHPQPLEVSPYTAWPVPLAPLPTPPRCPATTRHAEPHSVEIVGLQCHYGPGHDGDHAAYAGFAKGDVFWPQAAGIGAVEALAAQGYEVVMGTRKGPGCTGIYVALEHLDLGEPEEFYGDEFDAALGAAHLWAALRAATAREATT